MLRYEYRSDNRWIQFNSHISDSLIYIHSYRDERRMKLPTYSKLWMFYNAKTTAELITALDNYIKFHETSTKIQANETVGARQIRRCSGK
jgi:hypothetical protein